MQIHPSRIGIVLVKFLLVGAEFYLPVENFLVGRELFTGGEYVCWSNIFFFTARQENTGQICHVIQRRKIKRAFWLSWFL